MPCDYVGTREMLNDQGCGGALGNSSRQEETRKFYLGSQKGRGSEPDFRLPSSRACDIHSRKEGSLSPWADTAYMRPSPPTLPPQYTSTMAAGGAWKESSTASCGIEHVPSPLCGLLSAVFCCYGTALGKFTCMCICTCESLGRKAQGR